MGVEQAEVADLDEQRQDRRGEGEGQAEDEIVEQELLAEEAQMGEGEGGRRRNGQRQEHGPAGDEQGIQQHLPVAPARQDAPVVLPLPFVRQADIGAQVAGRLEAAEHGEEQRHDNHARNKEEDEQPRQSPHRRRQRYGSRGADRPGRRRVLEFGRRLNHPS